MKDEDSFDLELEEFKSGKLPASHIFNLGKPGEILQKCGFPAEHRIELAAARLRMKATQGNHPFDIMDIQGLAAALQKPVAVFEYGDKNKSQNVIVNLEKDGKNFLVGVFFNQIRDGFEVSSIRGLFNRDNMDWIHWIQQGKMIYGNKEKIQVLAEQQRTNLADVNNKEARTSSDSYYLDSVDNILQSFGDVKDIYTKNYPGYAEQKERFEIFKKFRNSSQKVEAINFLDVVQKADEFYDALKSNNKEVIARYTDAVENPELADAVETISTVHSVINTNGRGQPDPRFSSDSIVKEKESVNKEKSQEIQYAEHLMVQGLDSLDSNKNLDQSNSLVNKKEIQENEKFYNGINENIFESISDYLENGFRPKNDRFIIGKTPLVLQITTSNFTEVTIPTSVIKKAVEIHNLSKKEIFDSIYKLYNPVLIFDSDKNATENKIESKLILTDVFKDEKPIALAVNINTDIKLKDSNISVEVQDIRSIHDRTVISKNGTDLIKKWTENGLCRYVDDKKIANWSSLARVQFPIEPHQLAENNILTKTELVNKTVSTLVIDSNQAARIKAAREIKENMPNLSEKERAAAIAILEAGAKSQGMEFSEYVEKTFPDGIFGDIRKAENAAKQHGVNINGAVSVNGFGENVRAVIYAGKTADFSTWCHELSHVWQAQLTGELKQNAEEAFQVKDSDWQNSIYTFQDGHTDTSAEAFAYGFEDFLKNKAGEMATEDKKKIFEKFADYMSRTYNGVKQHIEINEKIASVYQKLVELDDNILAQAEKAVQMEVSLNDYFDKTNSVFFELDSGDTTDVSNSILEGKPIKEISSKEFNYDGSNLKDFALNYIKNNPIGNAKTKIGNVEISETGLRHSLSHTIYKNKLYAIPAIKDTLEKGTYLGVIKDFEGKRQNNYYFAAPITIDNDKNILFIRVKHVAGREKALYIHDIFTLDEIKKVTPYSGEPNATRRSLRGATLAKSIIQDYEKNNIIQNNPLLFQTAYHGSGASFDKFNVSEYGLSGEGYMAFGYGTYVTDSEAIAKDYASLNGKREAGKRHFYTVEIPDGNYLKWEKKVGVRTIKKVAAGLENLGIKNISFIRKGFEDLPLASQLNYVIHNESMTNKGSGKDLYITVGTILHSPADKETSRFFKDIGFSGIEYPAGTFFGERLNAVNYVIFNDEDIKIKEHFQFQIIGENGALKLDQSEKNNFRIENLKIAQEMAAKGKDEKSIRFATGWEKGVDNKWRYEIDDSKYSFDLINKTKNFERNNPRYVELVKKSLNQYNGGEDLSDQEWDELDKFSDIVWNEYYEAKQVWLTDVLDAPELYEAYPQLKDVTVVFDNNPYSPELGSYTKIKYLDSNKTGALIKLNKQPGETDVERYNATMLHEIQHIIQDIEGFAYGGNLEQFVEDDKETAFEKYSSLAGEVESRNVENRMNMTQEERKNILLSATEDIPRNNQIIQFPKQKEDIIMENAENFESQEYWKEQFQQDNAETFKAIDDYLDKGIKPKNDEFIFEKVPEILKSANVSENEIVIKTSIINKAKNEHSLSDEEIKDSIKNIASPVLIFDSDKTSTENKKESFLCLTDTFAENGKPIAFSMNLDSDYEKSRSILNVNQITSIHDRTLIAKNGTDLIQKWTENGLCRYVDDKKISEWQLAAGVQFPLAVLHSDKNNILSESDFVNGKKISNLVKEREDSFLLPLAKLDENNISLSTEIVNGTDYQEIKTFSKFAEQQKAMEKERIDSGEIFGKFENQQAKEELNVATYKFQSGETLDEIIQGNSDFPTETAFLDNLIDGSIREVHEYATEEEQKVLRQFASFRNDYDADMKNLAVQTDCISRWIAARHWNPEMQEFQQDYVNHAAVAEFPYKLPWEMKNIEDKVLQTENEIIDNGIESIQVNSGMSEAAIETEMLAKGNNQPEVEEYNDGQLPLQVVAQSDFNYFNSDKISFTEYVVRTDASVAQDLIRKNADSFNNTNTKLEENAIPCIIVRKSVNPEIPEQFLLSKYENNNLNKEEIAEQVGKFASKEIKIEDTELISQIKNVIEWNDRQNKTQVDIPELKIHHTLKEDEVRNLKVISDQEFSDVVDSILLNDYKNIPNAIRLPNLNEKLSEKLGLEKDSAFILKKNATHIRPDRKAGYGQAFDAEEYRKIPEIIRNADFAVVDTVFQNFQIVFDDKNDGTKINKLVFNKDELGNYLVTLGKVDRESAFSEERNPVVAVGVAPTIQTLRTNASSTALRASTTTVDESISQVTQKSINEEKIKMPDQLVYAAAEVGQVIEQRVQDELGIVNPTRADRLSTVSVPLGKEYNEDFSLSTEKNILETQKTINEQKTKLQILEQEDKEQLEAIVMTVRETIKESLSQDAEPIVEIDFTKANYDRLFPFGIVQTPLEKVKLGENQFEKLDAKDRKRFLLATFQALATPDLVIDEEREGSHSHNYIKSFIFDEKTKAVQDVVVNINGENISITAHPRDINNVVNKIKMPDQLIYAAARVGQVIEQRTQEAQSIVNPTRADRLSTISVPLNKEYNMENALSIISEFQTFKGQKTEPEFMKKLDSMRDVLRTRVEDEGNIISKEENNENKNAKQKITTKTDIIKKGAEDFKKAIEEGSAPFLSNEKDDFGVISLRPALIVNASNGLPFSGESQLLAQIYHHQQKMESEVVTSFAGAKDAGTKVVKNNESKKSFALTDTKRLDKKIALVQTRYFTPEACEEPDKLYAHVLQKRRPEKINSYRDLIQHFEKIPNGQKEISDLRIKIAREHLKEIQSRFAVKEDRTFTVDEIKERKTILQNYFSNLPEKYRSEEKSAFENTFGIVLNPEEDLKINLEGKFESARQFQEAVKSSEKTINIENQKLSSFIQKNSMQNEKLSHIFHEEYKKQKEEDKETSKNLKIEAKGISEPEIYLGKYLAACSSNAEFVTDPATVETVRKNLVNKLEKNYRLEKYEILKEIGQQAQQIALETTQQMAFSKAHSNKKKQDKNLDQEIGPVGMGR